MADIEKIPYIGDDRPDVNGLVTRTRQIISGPWIAVDPQDKQLKAAAQVQAHAFFYLTPPDVKLFCTTCNRVEAFNAVSAEDFSGRGLSDDNKGHLVARQVVQIFAFSYLCQSCKEVPEVFLVRRQGSKLTNVGRSPIEHVDVPPDIPKHVMRFFGGAIVAHQSGQTLAGLFLLRTLLEQFARATTDSKATNADEVMEAYMATLPPDFRSRFPSMRDLYGELSVDLHTATGSAELFDSTRDRIAQHFEVRRIYRLPDRAEPVTQD